VIPTHDRCDSLRGVLEALSRQTVASDRFEVVVICDGCTDGTESMCRALPTDYPLRVMTQEQSGPAAARNCGVAEATGPLIIFYNVDMFNKFGVPLPKTDWTFDDMLAAAVKLTQGTGVNQTWGYEGSPGNFGGEANTNYTMPFGARFLDKDEVTFMADTSEAATALQWWADLRLKSKVNPTPADTKVVAGDPFAFNKTAMMYSGSWSVPWLHEQAKFQYDVAPFPAGPKKHVTAAEGSGYGITKDSKDRDAAWTYQSAYLGEKGVEFMWGETGRGSPARKAAWQSYFKSPLAPKSAKLIYDALLTYGDGADVIQSPNGAEISRVAGQSWDLVLLGQMGAKDALSRIGTELGPVLEKNKPYVGLFG